MFDVALVKKRYFSVKIGDIAVDIEPCKLKTLKKFRKGNGDVVGIAQEILNKNAQGVSFGAEMIEDLEYSQIAELLTAYFKWLKDTRDADPN